MRTLVYPEWLIDGTGATARAGYGLAFAEDGRIEAVAPASDLVAAALKCACTDIAHIWLIIDDEDALRGTWASK